MKTKTSYILLSLLLIFSCFGLTGAGPGPQPGGKIYTADGTTLSLTGSQFSVKDGGIGSTQLAGSIPLSKLAGGSADRLIITSPSGVPSVAPALTATRILYANASGIPTGSSNLNWDNTNARLSVGIGSSPTYLLDLYGVGAQAINLANDTTTSGSGKGFSFSLNADGTGAIAHRQSYAISTYINGSEVWRWLTSGNAYTPYSIGSGLTTPQGNFHAYAANNPSFMLSNDATSSTSGDGSVIALNTDGSLVLSNRESSSPIRFYLAGAEKYTFNASSLTMPDGSTLALSGNHPTTFTTAGTTNVTLPTSGTLLSTAAAVSVAQGGTGAATAEAAYNAVADLKIEPSSDATANGPHTDDLNAGGTVTAMDLVILNSSGQWVDTDANSSSTYAGMVGIALQSKTVGQALNVALKGAVVRNDAWNWTPGAVIYMSETAGALTATQPTTTDAAIRVIGFALTDDAIMLDPSPDYITHS